MNYIVHNVEQGTEDWMAIRAGIVTCSELDHLVTPLWKPRDGQGVESYLARKLAERWHGRPVTSFGGGALEQGSIREEMAVPFLAFTHNLPIERVGFVTTADGRIGCSPDGVVRGDGGRIVNGCEIKCPEAYTHALYLMRGTIPKDYAAQVQGAMAVTGAAVWTFMSWSVGMPPLVVTVPRDEAAIAAIRSAVDAFNVRLDTAYARVVELNGGEPAKGQ